MTKCEESIYGESNKKVPHKVLYYIPIILCLGQLFMCKNIKKLMDCHAKNKSEDCILQILADGSIFRNIK